MNILLSLLISACIGNTSLFAMDAFCCGKEEPPVVDMEQIRINRRNRLAQSAQYTKKLYRANRERSNPLYAQGGASMIEDLINVPHRTAAIIRYEEGMKTALEISAVDIQNSRKKLKRSKKQSQINIIMPQSSEGTVSVHDTETGNSQTLTHDIPPALQTESIGGYQDRVRNNDLIFATLNNIGTTPPTPVFSPVSPESSSSDAPTQSTDNNNRNEQSNSQEMEEQPQRHKHQSALYIPLTSYSRLDSSSQ